MDIIRAGGNPQIDSSGNPTDVGRRATKSITFNGTTVGGIGVLTLFTVTGEVLIKRIMPFCITGPTGTATASISLGITVNGVLFAAGTTAINMDTDEWWLSGTPSAGGAALVAAMKEVVTTNDVILTVATDVVSDGSVRFDIDWEPLSAGSTLVAA